MPENLPSTAAEPAGEVQPISAQDILPFVDRYFTLEEEKNKREANLEEQRIQRDGRQNEIEGGHTNKIIYGTYGIVGCVFALTAVLFAQGQQTLGTELIRTIITAVLGFAAGVGFGRKSRS